MHWNMTVGALLTLHPWTLADDDFKVMYNKADPHGHADAESMKRP